jgi:subtilisin-like proprotein convertase family protein
MINHYWKLGVFIPLFLLIYSITWANVKAEYQVPAAPDPMDIIEPDNPNSIDFSPSIVFSQTVQISDTMMITDVAVITSTAAYTIHLPLVIQPPPPPTFVLYCKNFENPVSIPDNNAAGLTLNLSPGDEGKIYDMNVRVEATHPWVGDLLIRLMNSATGKTSILLDRPGYPASNSGCSGDGVGAIFDDEVSIQAENQCYSGSTAIAGIYLPVDPLSTMDHENFAGTWTLQVSDLDSGDVGKINNWCIEALIGKSPYSPPEPPIPELPSQAQITNITGKKQALPLDCEARVAVDWAKYFGKNIDELTFQNRLPKSDNPDQGFVGNVNGFWGQIPPSSYGVHAGPIVDLLRTFGVSAYGHRPLNWNQLKAEIAASRPVIVWVAGSANRNEIPIYYTSTEGNRTIVAHYEHTVMVVGYTQTSVTILDGGTRINRTLDQFLSSWSALDNMAIAALP